MTSFNDLLRHDPALRVGATAVYPFTPKLEKKYRFTSRFGEEVLLHKTDGKIIHLPRALCPDPVAGSLQDQRSDGEVVDFPKDPTPRPNQIDLFNKTAKFLREGKSGLVCAYTGWGKTVLGYHAAFICRRKTLVVTTKDDIYQQWLDGAVPFLGLDPSEVGEIRQDKCEVVGTKFVVAMIHSLSIDGRYPDWITKDFGLVIFDECHRLPAEHFSAVATMFPAKLRLGMSAQPERSDGKELLVAAHIGPVRAATDAQLMIPKVLRFKSNWQCPRTLRTDPDTGEKKIIKIPHEPGKTIHIEKMLAADSERNHFIAELVASAFEKDRKIVVFSTLLDHLKSLHRILRDKHKISGRHMGFYIGCSTKAEKEQRDREKIKPLLFTTYGMMGEGTNIPWLDTAVLATPRSNVTQPVGRVRREYPDKGVPVVIDIMDTDSPVFSGYCSSRMRWYVSIKANVIDMV